MPQNHSNQNVQAGTPSTGAVPPAPPTVPTAPSSMESGTAPGAAPTPKWKVAAVWCLAHVRDLARKAWGFVSAVAQYYWSIRRDLWEYITGYAINMIDESVRRREVRLEAYESNPLVDFDSSGWKVAVPDRCVVCGEKTANAPLDEIREPDDAARALLVPFVTLCASCALALFVWSRWVVILGAPVGFVLGYLLRTKAHVHLRLRRCDQHLGRSNIPDVLAWGNTLVLRFGHKTVRQVFLFGEQMEETVPQTENAPAVSDTAAVQVPSSVPETIPLADDVPEGADSTIRHDSPREPGSDGSVV